MREVVEEKITKLLDVLDRADYEAETHIDSAMSEVMTELGESTWGDVSEKIERLRQTVLDTDEHLEYIEHEVDKLSEYLGITI